MVEISLEDDKVRGGEVEEEIGGLGLDVPEGVAGDPERVLLVDPLALGLVLLPALAHLLERGELVVGLAGEEVPVDHRVEEPVPILLGHVRDEPREALAVEPDLPADARLDEPVGVDQVAVELEPGVVEDEVDPAILHRADELPELVQVVS